MARPDIVAWFDTNWIKQRDRALQEGFKSLARPDQVLVAVGFLLDSCVGDAAWVIVDGVVEGKDRGLTALVPAALNEMGLAEPAEHVREVIRLRTKPGTPEQIDHNRELAMQHWDKVKDLVNQWSPDGERAMLTRLYGWYHSQPTPRP